MKTKSLLVVMIVAHCGFNARAVLRHQESADQNSLEAEYVDYEFDEEEYFDLDAGQISYDPVIAEPNENHKHLRWLYDVPGIDEPLLVTSNQAKLKDSSTIIGINVAGKACAFPLGTMNSEDSHIVNCLINDVPISVSYCPLVENVRVFTSDIESAIPLRLGGLNEEDEMVLLLDGERYDMSSDNVPLNDYQFTRCTFEEWKKLHPLTQVFVKRTRKPM